MKKPFLLLLLVGFACSGSTDTDPSPLQELDPFGKALAQVEQVTNELEYIGRSGLISIPLVFAPCATVLTETDGGFTVHTLYFNNTACADGKVRNGEMRLAVNTETKDVIIQLNVLWIDGVKVEGVYTLQAVTENGVEVTKLLASGAKITRSNGDWFSFTTTKHYQWKEGKDTPSAQDDVLDIVAGEYFITLKNGGLCQLGIDAPLRISYACNARDFLPVSGLVTLDAIQEISRVNFGNGECSGNPTQQEIEP